VSSLARQLALCLCAAALLLPAFALAKPPEGIKLDVQVGHDGWVQLTAINPVIVDLENNSQSLNLSGDLALVYNGIEYSTRLELPRPTSKRYFLYFPCDNYPPFLMLRIRTKQYTEQFDLSQQYKPMALGDISAMVLTQQSGSLGAVNQLPAVRLQRDLYQHATAQLATGKVFVSYYDLPEIDPTPKFFSGADMVVLADIDYTQVTPELAEALKAYVIGGGSLVFSLGLNGAGVAASPLAPLCPIAVSGTTQLTDLGDFGRLYKIPAGSVATLATGRVAPDAETVFRAAGLPAVIRRVTGSGIVTALTFDYTQAPFRLSPALGRLFSENALRISSSVSVTNWFVHPGVVSEILRKLSEAVPMQPLFVLMFLGAYVVLVGPLNFLILSKLKRRTLVWTTIPAIILGFSWIGLQTGHLYRGSNNICAYFQELHLYPGSAYSPYQTVMLIFTAERTEYKLTVPDASAFLYPVIPAVAEDDMYGRPAPLPPRMHALGNSRVDNSKLPTVTTNQGKWTSKEYFYQGYVNCGAKVSADLSAVRRDGGIESVSGRASLDLPFDLYDAYLLGPQNSVSQLGYVTGQGTRELHWRGATANPPLAGLDSNDYLVQQIGELSDKQRLCSSFSLQYRDELLLVGFTDRVEALAKFNRPHKEHLLTMVVLHLPYEAVVPTSGGLSRGIRGILLGGSDIERRENTAYGYMPEEYERVRQYTMRANSYLDVAYEVSGDLNGSTGRLLMHLKAMDPGNYEPLQDLTYVFSLYGWDGREWTEIDIPENTTGLDVPMAGLLDEHRRVTLRFRAKKDCVLEVPSADAH
jgi:hypothetical protein